MTSDTSHAGEFPKTPEDVPEDVPEAETMPSQQSAPPDDRLARLRGPFYRFVPGTTAPERVLSYASLSHGSGPLDDVLARAADSGWGHLELPARHTLDQDPEVADALAATAARLLERGALAFAQDGGHLGQLESVLLPLGCAPTQCTQGLHDEL